MSLRPLATCPIQDDQGIPFADLDLYGGSLSLTLFVWYRGVGLYMMTNATRSLVSLDGILQTVGYLPGQSPRHGWWTAGKILTWQSEMEKFLDNRALLLKPVQFQPAFMPTSGLGNHGYAITYVRHLDRWYWYSGLAGIQSMDAFGNIVTDHPLFGGQFDNGAYVWAGRGDGELFVSSRNSPMECCFYSTVTKQRTSRTMTLPANIEFATYAPEFEVIVGLTTAPRSVQVISLETWPVAISEPELVTGLVQQGHGATFRARVTGDAGDACVGERVNWQISGSGTLLNTQTVTDDSGYATVGVSFGIDDTDASEITASLKC